MARLVLRSVGDKDRKEEVVESTGAILGRDGQEADILLADKSVSKRHARLFLHKGRWMLEDLGSSNGTFLGDGRVTSPVPLKVKSRFSIGVFTWEVTSLDPAGGDAPPPSEDTASDFEASDPNQETRAAVPAMAKKKEEEKPREKEKSASARKAAPRPAPDASAEGRSEELPAPAPLSSKPPLDPSAEVPAPELGGDPRSVKFYLAALPRSIAYHLANVPLLVLNPMGTVRKSVEKTPLPELTWPGLIVYALPANLFSAAVTFLCTLIMQLVTGTLSLGGIIPVVPLAIALGGSIVGGLACHPVLTFIVDKLKGQSTARQRTNYFVLCMSAVVIISIPSGLSILLASVRVPFIGVLPVLLSLIGTALMVLISYRWFTAFNVVKWFRIALLVLGGLAAAGALKNVVDVVLAGVKTLGSSSSSSSGASGSSGSDAAEKAAEEHKEAAEKAEKAAEKAPEKAEKTAEKPAEKAEKGEKAEEPEAGKKGKGAKKGKTTEETAPAEKAAAAPRDYATYLEHRDAMEKALEQNPRLLKSVPGLLALYEKYHRTVFDIRNRKDAGGKKKAAPEPALEPVRQRLKDIEVQEKTQDLVEELYRKVQ